MWCSPSLGPVSCHGFQSKRTPSEIRRHDLRNVFITFVMLVSAVIKLFCLFVDHFQVRCCFSFCIILSHFRCFCFDYLCYFRTSQAGSADPSVGKDRQVIAPVGDETVHSWTRKHAAPSSLEITVPRCTAPFLGGPDNSCLLDRPSTSPSLL